MTAPNPNITLVDGRRVYLPPTACMHLRRVSENDPAGMSGGRTIHFSRMEDLGLIEGVRQRGNSTWTWFLAEQGKKVIAELQAGA